MLADVVTVLDFLFRSIKRLWDQAALAKQNRRECQRLAEHARTLAESVKCQHHNKPISKDLEMRLTYLYRELDLVRDILGRLGERPFLQRWILAEDVSTRVKEAYARLKDAVSGFKLGNLINISQLSAECENARREDMQAILAQFAQVQKNDQALYELFQIKTLKFQDAIQALHKRFDTFQSSLEQQLSRRLIEIFQQRSFSSSAVLFSERPVLKFTEITEYDIMIKKDKPIGTGGYGKVYKGLYQGMPVAVKILHPSIPESMIIKELTVWKDLNHRNILRFHGASPFGDTPFFVCDLMQNGNVTKYLENNPKADRKRLVRDAARGLRYLHEVRVIHGDIKAANILVDRHGVACLSDFGLSRFKEHTSTIAYNPYGNTASPATIMQRGTARWMAPEQILSGVSSRETDVYSFGITMYEVFAGSAPFGSSVDTVILRLVVERGHRPPRPERHASASVCPHFIDDKTWELIQRAWHQEPQRRPDTLMIVKELESLISMDEVEGRAKQAGVNEQNVSRSAHGERATGDRRAKTGKGESSQQRIASSTQTSSIPVKTPPIPFVTRPAPNASCPPDNTNGSFYKLSEASKTSLPATNRLVRVEKTHAPSSFRKVGYASGYQGQNRRERLYRRRSTSEVLASTIKADFTHEDPKEIRSIHRPSHIAHKASASYVSLVSETLEQKSLNPIQPLIRENLETQLLERPPKVHDRILQTLFDMVRTWPLDILQQALESCLEPGTMNDVALSVWSMGRFKRAIQDRVEYACELGHPIQDHCAVPTLVVPPHITKDINRAIEKGDLEFACVVLKEMWAYLGQEVRPRTVLVFGRHWSSARERRRWVVLKFSLDKAHLVVYELFFNCKGPPIPLEEPPLPGWWDAINSIWREVPHCAPTTQFQALLKRVEIPESQDIPVATAVIFYNLLFGSDPARQSNLDRVREVVRKEVEWVITRKEKNRLDYRC